jgi:hypothetical protein
VPHELDGAPMRRRHGHELVDQSFRIDPAQRMRADPELAGSAARTVSPAGVSQRSRRKRMTRAARCRFWTRTSS